LALTKQRRLVLSAYMSGPDVTLEDALIKVGYSPKRATITACELRRDPEFVAAIERRQLQALEKLQRRDLTDQTVIDGILDIDAEAKSAGPVASFLQIRVKCHELLARVRGMLTERVQLGFDDELMEKLVEGRKRAGIEGEQPGKIEEVPVLEGEVVN
jgi:hypothetical protein